MLKPALVANTLIENVYHKDGLSTHARLHLIEEAAEAASFNNLQAERRTDEKLLPDYIHLLSVLACRRSLEVVSYGIPHNQADAAGVLVDLSILAEEICAQSSINRRSPYTIGKITELGILGSLWSAFATDSALGRAHARLTRIADDEDTLHGLPDGFDISLTLPSPNKKAPKRERIQVKTSAFSDQHSYGNNIRVVSAEKVVGTRSQPQEELLTALAELDIEQLAGYGNKVLQLVRDQRQQRSNSAPYQIAA